jgi:DNA-binding CsgD family transcriptional regulator
VDRPEAQIPDPASTLPRTAQPGVRVDYPLTPQESQLLWLLIAGHHKKAAARAMGISINTVSFHLKNLYVKLQVHSKTEAVVKALQEGLVVVVRCDRCRSESFVAAQEAVPETARYNHARTNVHSRSTVARDTPTFAAISSIVRPPKNMSSTI